MSKEVRIVVLTAPDEGELPGLESIQDEADIRHVSTEDELRDVLPNTDILVVTDFRTEVLRRAWPRKHHIQWLHATSAGVDRLMFPELAQSDLTISNARGVFDRGIAEYVLGAVLLFAKDTLNNIRLQREHVWQHRETELLNHRKALIVGAGSIGKEVASYLRGVGMQVIATASRAREDAAFDAVYASEDLYMLLPDADFVVITAPLTEQTRGLFNREAFEHMHPGARLINVGRGPVVRTADLVDALQNGRIAGAALDVFEEEPLAEDSPLWDMPNVMISAHMAGDFKGWQKALGEQFVDNFRLWQQHKSLKNIIDKERGYASGK
ncbi:MAG: D-2-hydroxyacid dehydrogenase [Granulosicoccaceae bacterium]|jgi:phosphoglycerate dehydrogenase-like enzyme